MSNLHECTDDDLQQLADIAERNNDWRSYNAALVEIKRRQDHPQGHDMRRWYPLAAPCMTRRTDMDIIRDVAARYSEEGLRR